MEKCEIAQRTKAVPELTQHEIQSTVSPQPQARISHFLISVLQLLWRLRVRIHTSSKQPWRLAQPGPGLSVMSQSSWLVSHCTCVLFSCLHQSLICLSWQIWQVEVLAIALTLPKYESHIKTSSEHDSCEINWLTHSIFLLQNNSEMPDLDTYICFQLCFIIHIPPPHKGISNRWW